MTARHVMGRKSSIVGLGVLFLVVVGSAVIVLRTGEVDGLVTVGPMCPMGCTDRPVAGIVVHFVASGSSGSETANAATDSRGRFAVRLPQGDYSVRLSGRNPVSPDIGTLGAYGPQKIHVSAAQVTHANYHLFSGIL